jgi:hypothetical protein
MQQPPSDPQAKDKALVSETEKVDIESSGGGQSPTLASKEGDFEQEIDPVAEARLLRKLDWILLPMFTAICKLLHSFFHSGDCIHLC